MMASRSSVQIREMLTVLASIVIIVRDPKTCALFLLANKIRRWTAVNIERAHKMQSSLIEHEREREKKQ